MAVDALPDYPLGNIRVWLRRMDLNAPESSGRVGGVQMGFPIWMAEYEAPILSDLDFQLWQAWLARQRGSINQFKATDPKRWYPWAYRPKAMGGGHSGAGGFPGGWNGDATSFSLSGDRSTVTLTIPSGIVITAGDFIGFRWSSGDKLAMVMALEGGTSSGTVEIDVDPAVPSAVPSHPTAVAYVYKPAFLAKLTSETEIGASSPDGQASLKLVAQQDIVP